MALVNAEPLKKDDKIIFLGDSITAGGVKKGGYVTLTSEAIEKAYPDLGIEIIGAGVSGNKVPDLKRRMGRYFPKEEPTVAVIYIGINDVWHWPEEGAVQGKKKGTTKEEFDKGLREIIAEIKSSGARVILCTPTVIGEKKDGANDRDEMLDEYAAISRKVAEDTESQLLDLREEFVDFLKENNPDNLGKGVLTRDGVHMNPKGNRYLAKLMLEALEVPVDDSE